MVYCGAVRNQPRGFTLVELLVVIGIIALLVAVLLPTLGRARNAARTAQCLDHQRQIATATILYANDYDGHLPYDSNSNVTKTDPNYLAVVWWYHFLADMPPEFARQFGRRPNPITPAQAGHRQFIGDRGYLPWSEKRQDFTVLQCPIAQADLMLDASGAVNQQVACHYGINVEIVGKQDRDTGRITTRRLASIKGRPMLTADTNLRYSAPISAFHTISFLDYGNGTNLANRRFWSWPLQKIDRSNNLPMDYAGHGTEGTPAAVASFLDGSATSIRTFEPEWFE